MGLGGDLMWTTFAKNYHSHYNCKPFLCKLPKFSDLLVGRMYDCNFSYNKSIIFYENIHFETNKYKKKTKIILFIDLIFEQIKKKLFDRIYQDFIYKLLRKKNKNIIYTNYYKNSYFYDYYFKDKKKALLWSINFSFVEHLCNNYLVKYKYELPEINYNNDEIEKFNFKINKFNLEKYIVINTDSKFDYFGNIRKWPENNWLKFINSIKIKYPTLNIVELNINKPLGSPKVIEIGKSLTFRECGLLIKNSQLFIGTDGGLTHLSAAVRKKAIVIWSSLIKQEITGYPSFHTILNKKTECSNYGHLGWCKKCTKDIKEISYENVFDLTSKYLNEL